MRPMMRLFLGLIALVGIMAAVAVGLPAHVTVQRAVVINAPESAVFPYLNDIHKFGDWSPWKLRDPNLELAYSGPQQGKGATVAWHSDKRSIGSGSMEIVESNPNRTFGLAVNYNGLEGTGGYDIAPSGSGSKVTWNFGYDTGSSPMRRWKGLALDGLIGAEYQAGLNKLKEKIEADRKPLAPVMVPGAMQGAPGFVGAVPQGVLPQGAAPGAAVPMNVPPAPGAAPQQAPAASASGNAPTAEAAPEPEEAAPAPAPKKKKRRRR
jgi:hypothetical protein